MPSPRLSNGPVAASRRVPSPALARLLLTVAVLGFTGSVIAGLGWWRAASMPVAPEDLSPDQRQRLVTELMEVSAGVHEGAWYNPEIGYALRRNTEVEAWNDTFLTNSLGFRAGPAQKTPGTFRVLFVGDSWTFGMGVRQPEAFPSIFEDLANQYAGLDRPVEAWSLALPGYNTLNELAALWFYFERLQPDAVVLVPSSNDNHSLSSVLPNGSLFANGQRPDEFGDPHHVSYPLTHLASHRYRQRWRKAFAAIRETEERLKQRSIPFQLFFLARWKPAVAHHFVADAGLSAPYQIVPVGLTQAAWINPRPLGHGTVEANRVYGHFVYRGVAEHLGWPPLPAAATESADLSRRAQRALQEPLRLIRTPSQDRRWHERAEAIYREMTTQYLPEEFRAGPSKARQAAGPFNPDSGEMGRATTLLVRRPPGAQELSIRVAAAPAAQALFPLTLTVSVPARESPSRFEIELPDSTPVEFELPLPPEIPPGDALDVVFEASRIASDEELLAPRSVRILSILPR